MRAQIEDPTKKDWYSAVLKDLQELGLNYLDLDEIQNMKKETFKKLVKEKCDDVVLNYLLEGNDKKSKMKDLKYYQLKMQPYLSSSKLSTRRKKYLFQFRTRMVPVGHNSEKKVSCPVCKSDANSRAPL